MSTGTLRKSPHLSLVGREASRPDPQIQKAIAQMRSQLDRRWTVTALARSVGLSRPVFARRFVEQTGVSPLRYLTRCRMERAAEILSESDAALARIGSLVGYDSEFAFNRAFKRQLGVTPGGFRRQAQLRRGPVFRAAA